MICRRTVLCVISVLSFSIVTTVSFAGSQLGTNVALNKTVTPVAGQGVVDGDIFLGWFANESLDPPACTDCIRFTVDLGSTRSIRRIAVNVVNTYSVAISSSIDGMNWVQRATQDWTVSYHGSTLVDSLNFNARYIKYEGSGDSSSTPGVNELEVYDTPAPSPPQHWGTEPRERCNDSI